MSSPLPNMPASPSLHSTTHTDREALKEIAKLMSQIMADTCHVVSNRRESPFDCSKISAPELELPFPHDILSPISQLPVSDDVRQKLVQSLRGRIHELQNEYIAAYKRACIAAARGQPLGNDFTVIRDTYSALYKKNCFPLYQNAVSFMFEEVSKYQHPHLDGSKPSFKSEYTPVLEKYFQFNGYPSVAHRSILARESGMLPRQIEVWFQNHRRRARSEGKVVQRLDSDIPLRRALETMTSRSGAQLSTPPPEKPKTIPKQANHKLSCLHKENAYRPPHAFPSLRTGDHPDPFPNDNGIFKFPAPIWRRKPATTIITPTAVDMDDFARQFHMRLNFINIPWKQERTSSKQDLAPFSPWFAPSRTIPPSAPLPALQRPNSMKAISTSILSSTIAMDPSTFVFPKAGQSRPSGQSDVTCIVRLPVGPNGTASSITDRIDRSVASMDLKGFRLRRRTLDSSRPSSSCLAFPGDIARRKGLSTSRRGPSSLQSISSRNTSFGSDTSSSSDDSSSPSTPPSSSNLSVFSDPVVVSDDLAVNFDSFLEIPSHLSFDLPSPKSPSDTKRSVPQSFDFTFTNPANSISQISSRTFEFAFPASSADRRSSPLHKNHAPLIFT